MACVAARHPLRPRTTGKPADVDHQRHQCVLFACLDETRTGLPVAICVLQTWSLLELQSKGARVRCANAEVCLARRLHEAGCA